MNMHQEEKTKQNSFTIFFLFFHLKNQTENDEIISYILSPPFFLPFKKPKT